MSEKYSNLKDLLQKDTEARKYFDSLPEYVQDTIMSRSGNVNSLLSLRDYAENLTRGDN